MIRCLGCMTEYDETILQKETRGICPVCGYIQDSPALEAYQLNPGTILEGKYIVGKVLGAGGFGVTYIGYDAQLERVVAIKEYLPGNFATRALGQSDLSVFPGESAEQFAAGLESFIDEAKLLASVSDIEGIVSVYDSFVANNTGYIVMEYLRGKTVRELLRTDGVMGYEQALGIISPVLDALAEVHKAGIVHRDIAPDNIFICDDISVRLIDFGASRYATTLHSKSLSVILKPGYAPEEQYRSKGVQGPFTDVYAASATLYKMITGITPEDAMDRSLEDKLQEPSKLGATLPVHAENAIMNALNVHAKDRYQTAADFKTALGLEDTRREKVTIRRPDAGRLPLPLRIAASFVVILIVGLGTAVLTGVIDLAGGGQLADPSLAFADGYMNTPDVQNMNTEDAQVYVEERGLYYLIVGGEASEEIPVGRILSQDPNPGSRIFQGEPLSVVISDGAAQALETFVMPRVVYKSEADAIALLDEAAIAYTIEYAESDEVASGHVVSQSIEAGVKVEGTERVTIVVSLGSEEQSRAIENMTSNAERPDDPLASSGSGSGSREGSGSGSRQGAGSGSGSGSRQDAAQEKVSVPNVVGSSEADAVSRLKSSGLNHRISYQRIVDGATGVYSQSVSAGSEVSAGTTVNLVVCIGEPAWTQWMPKEELPGGIAGNAGYQVQEDSRPTTDYRFRVLEPYTETTSNTTDVTPEGYSYSHKVQTGYSPGEWSGSKTQLNTKPTFGTTGGYSSGEITSEGYRGSGFGGWSGWTEGRAPADVYTNGVLTKDYEEKAEGIYKTQWYYERWVIWGWQDGVGMCWKGYGYPIDKYVKHDWIQLDWRMVSEVWDGEEQKPIYKEYNDGHPDWGWWLRRVWYNEQQVQVQTGTKYFYRSRTQSAVKYYEYHTRDINPTYTYYYTKTNYRWGPWSGWSADYVSAIENRQVETRQGTPVQYARFRRWTETVW